MQSLLIAQVCVRAVGALLALSPPEYSVLVPEVFPDTLPSCGGCLRGRSESAEVPGQCSISRVLLWCPFLHVGLVPEQCWVTH